MKYEFHPDALGEYKEASALRFLPSGVGTTVYHGSGICRSANLRDRNVGGLLTKIFADA